MVPTLRAAAPALIWMLGLSPAYALCELCTAEIRLDSSLAGCFVQRSAAALKQFSDPGKPFVIVDLRDCDSRGGLPMGATSESGQPILDTRFVLDQPGLQCLTNAIQQLDDAALTPSHVFDLVKDCPAP